ncbi:hypothetical protein SAY87_008793 [Trapa incisa]|uniref:Uncharacterized protein n=1 Tax=Trapa incisa TaxID=236973 RepID=A0AAN7JVU2_9MYRT|nr:hypothetical protein SAY87_008793 [Trapa incisa]
MVPTSSHCNVQRVGPDIKVHSSGGLHKARVTEGSHDRDPQPVPAHTSLLLYSQVWRPRVDDHAHLLPGTNKRLSHCLRHDSRTKRLQGSRAECTGELACAVSSWRIILRCCS